MGQAAEQRAEALGDRLDVLLAAGDAVGACGLVASAFAEDSDAGDLPEVAALVSALPDHVVAVRPQALLELARACDAEVRRRLRNRLLERAERLPVTDPAFALALEAERITDLARDAEADEVELRVAALTPRLEEGGDRLVREAWARTSYALGRVLAFRGDPASLSGAEDALTTAIGAARELGRHEWRAQGLVTLGFSVLFYRGEEVGAASRLREAIALFPVGHPRRTAAATFLAEVLVRSHVGHEAVPLLEEVRREAARTGDQRSLGYAAWIMAMHTAELGDAPATMEWLAEAERHPGDWLEHLVGLDFLTEAAIRSEYVGQGEAADRYLARAVERSTAAGFPEVPLLATGVIAARRGDPQLALDQLLRVLDEPWFPARDLWLVWLHLALARLRLGDADGSARDAARGRAAATAALVGPGRAAPRTEDLPVVLRRLQPMLLGRLDPSEQTPARVELLGGLRVRIAHGEAAVPPGRPALLLMLVALAHGPLGIDVAVDELWPDVTLDIGRRRLRNVLARIRNACGDLIVRTGDALTLAGRTSVDLDDFEAAAGRALRGPLPDRPSLAATALSLHPADLLPEAAYVPRVSRARDDLDRLRLRLLDVVATAAEQEGRVDDALAALAAAADIDPYDVGLLARIVELVDRAGRHGQAALWRARMARATED